MPWYKVCIRLINKLGFTVLFFLHKLKTYKNIYNEYCVVEEKSEIHKTDILSSTVENIQIVSKESQTIQNFTTVEENVLSKSSNQSSSPIRAAQVVFYPSKQIWCIIPPNVYQNKQKCSGPSPPWVPR